MLPVPNSRWWPRALSLFLQVAAVRAELQRQVGEAQALAESRVAGMRDMQDKIQHLNARVGCGC